MARNLKSVQAFARGRDWPESRVRTLLLQRRENGLVDAGVVVQVGRRVLIDDDRFDTWLESVQPRAAK